MNGTSIAIVSPGSFALPSGTSSSVEHVVERLADRLSSAARVTVLGRRTRLRPAREQIGGVAYVRPSFKGGQPYIAAVCRKLMKLKPDVIQVENRPRFVRYLRKRMKRAKICLGLHSITFISKPHIGRREVGECLRCADLIFVNSEFLRQQVISRVPSVADRVVVNPLGADPASFVPRWSQEEARQEMLASLGLAGHKIIVFAGRLLPMKGVEPLLRSMPAVFAAHPDAVLLVIGGAGYGSSRQTAYVKRLKRLASGYPGRIRFIPYVSHDQIPAWFRLADVVAVPSLGSEAFGLVNVEAMSCGVPVVATEIGGIPEIVMHEATGLLVPAHAVEAGLAESISRILADEELRRRMGEQAFLRASELYTWERMAERQRALYELLN
ncbi:glycosyltransferase family 4 protein [Paenibacillus sp. FJAT-26967]|uniref:glycosyltransferase family 4 protein n=1 Tax=Paenibacillus sp. FJAT-26967 TaxID=1729690 RepID=UPI000837F57E|nr:glycosyltransferase family 4 protein [Paenibacillus sp. FJAT-26967]